MFDVGQRFVDRLDVIGQIVFQFFQPCGRAFETGDMLPLCECGSADIAVEGGRELRIREVELA